MERKQIQYNHEAMDSLAAALSELETKYKFSVSPHPEKTHAFRIVFSRPTFQSPESPVFVTLDLEIAEYRTGRTDYTGFMEGLSWPITLAVVDNQIEVFPERYIDKIWLQKMEALQNQDSFTKYFSLMTDLEEELQRVAEDENEHLFKGLTFSQRIQGYLLFTSIALFSSLMSWFALAMGKYWKYTALSSFGTFLSLTSTFILMGPAAQLEYMMDEHRRGASMMYVFSVLLSIITAFAFKSTFLCVCATILQYCCLSWYSLSYIPYGREMALAFVLRQQ